MYSIAFNKDQDVVILLSSASSNLCSCLRCSCHSKDNSGLDYDYLLCPKISISVLGNTKPNLIYCGADKVSWIPVPNQRHLIFNPKSDTQEPIGNCGYYIQIW